MADTQANGASHAGTGGLEPPSLNRPPPLDIVRRETQEKAQQPKKRSKRSKKHSKKGFWEDLERNKHPYQEGPRPTTSEDPGKGRPGTTAAYHRTRAKLRPGSHHAVKTRHATNRMQKIRSRTGSETDEDRQRGVSSPDEVPDHAVEDSASPERFPRTAQVSKKKQRRPRSKQLEHEQGYSHYQQGKQRHSDDISTDQRRSTTAQHRLREEGTGSETTLPERPSQQKRASTVDDRLARSSRHQGSYGSSEFSQYGGEQLSESLVEKEGRQERRSSTHSQSEYTSASDELREERSPKPGFQQAESEQKEAEPWNHQSKGYNTQSTTSLPELKSERNKGAHANAWSETRRNKGSKSSTTIGKRLYMKSSSKKHSKSPKPVKSVAGYMPPTDSSAIRQEYLDAAKRIMEDEELLCNTLEDEILQKAAEQLGIDLDRMKRVEESAFRNTPATPRQTVAMRRRHYDNERERQLGLILSQRDSAYQENLELQKRKKQIQEAVKQNLEYNIETEERKLDKARQKREKVNRVIREDNARLRARKEHFEKARREEQERLERERQEQEQEDLRRKQYLKEKEEERKMKKRRAEEHEAAKMQAALDAIRRQQEKEREQAAERERQRQLEAKQQLEKKLDEERKRQQHEENLAANRERMLREYEEKERKIQAQKEEQAKERQRRREQRWMQMQRKQEDARRMMREREHRKRIEFEKEYLADKRVEAIKQMKRAFAKERQEQVGKEKTEYDEWRRHVIIEKNVTPGPADYRLASTAGHIGGKIHEGNIYRLQDSVIEEAKKKPAPGQHCQDDQGVRPNMHGGYISAYKGGGYIDDFFGTAKNNPGPMDYDPKSLKSCTGFNSGASSLKFQGVNNHLKAVETEAARSPGPGDHSSPSWSVNDAKVIRTAPSVEELREQLNKGLIPTVVPDGFGGTIVSGIDPNAGENTASVSLRSVLRNSQRSYLRIGGSPVSSRCGSRAHSSRKSVQSADDDHISSSFKGSGSPERGDEIGKPEEEQEAKQQLSFGSVDDSNVGKIDTHDLVDMNENGATELNGGTNKVQSRSDNGERVSGTSGTDTERHTGVHDECGSDDQSPGNESEDDYSRPTDSQESQRRGIYSFQRADQSGCDDRPQMSQESKRSEKSGDSPIEEEFED